MPLSVMLAGLAGLLLSQVVWSATPTGYIPSINAKVASLRFFENPLPPHVVPRQQRVYSNRFVKSQVRRIFWELDLTHPAPGRRVDFIIESVWYSPTGLGQGQRQSMRASLQGDWTWSYWQDGVRLIGKWKTVKPTGEMYDWEEPWPSGNYRVDIYVAGTMVASGSFEITDGGSSARSGSASPPADNATKAAEAAYHEADRLTDRLKFREAIPYLDKAIALNPNLLSAYALRGYSYNALSYSENKPEYQRRAIEDYTTAIQKGLQRGVRTSGWYNSRGAIYMSLHEDQRALQDFNEAIKVDPSYATAISNRGELRRRMGDLDGSIADLTKVIELEPKVGKRYCQRGLTWLRKARDAEAERDFRRCGELDPKARQEYTTYINNILEERRKKR